MTWKPRNGGQKNGVSTTMASGRIHVAVTRTAADLQAIMHLLCIDMIPLRTHLSDRDVSVHPTLGIEANSGMGPRQLDPTGLAPLQIPEEGTVTTINDVTPK